jgi:hypothetical protein
LGPDRSHLEREVEHVLFGQEGMIHAVAYSPDGRLVAAATWQGKVCLWDTVTRQAHVLPAFPMPGAIVWPSVRTANSWPRQASMGS